jgi:hypothetical protein
MAIARVQQPNRWSSVYAPIIYKFKSSFATGYRIGNVLTPAVIGETNGFLTITWSTAHGMRSGDYVYINSDFSGAYRVISCPGSAQTIIDVNATAGQNCTSGYWYAFQYNASVRVWAEIDNVFTDIGTITTKPVDDGTDIIFTFDVSTVLRNYITSNLPDLRNGSVQHCPDAFKSFYIEYREEYVRGVAGITQYVAQDWETDTDSSYYDTNDKVAVNSTEQYDENIGDPYKQSEYVFGIDNGTVRLLTNQPDGVPYCADRKYWLYFNADNLQTNHSIVFNVEQYGGGGNLITTSEIEYEDVELGQNLVEISNETFTLNANAAKICVTASLPEYQFHDNLKQLGSWSLQDNGVNIVFGSQGALFNQNTIPLPTLSVNGYMDRNVLANGIEYEFRITLAFTNNQPSGVITIDAGGNGTSTHTISTAGTHTFTLTANGPTLRLQATYYDNNNVANEFRLSNLHVHSTITEDSQPVCFSVEQNCECTDKYYKLVWLNNKGGYSSFYFTGRATHGIEVDRQRPIKYALVAGRFEPSNRQYANLRNIGRKRITLRNETMNKDINTWLANELMTSIDVYLEQTVDGVNYFLPVQIENDSIDIRKDGDKRYSLVLDAIYAYDIISQTR